MAAAAEPQRRVLLPEEGATYQDDSGRRLLVHKVALGDPLGREVRGLVWPRGGEAREYSTTVVLWSIIWRQ